jgi:hypothetical protein
MKHARCASLCLCLTTAFLWSQTNPVLVRSGGSVGSPISAPQTDPKVQVRIIDGYGKLPLSFEANHGQTDSRVKFLSRTGGYTLFLTQDEAVLTLRGKTWNAHNAKVTGVSRSPHSNVAEVKSGGVLRMKLHGANAAARVTGIDELAGTSNYFIGNDPDKWRTAVPTFAKVKYEGIYSGINLVYYGNQRQLEYDFIVSPGADPHRIAFDVHGAKRIRRDAHGDLVFKIGEDEIRWHKPAVYQERDGSRQVVAANYAITNNNRVGFEVAKYDPSRPLYIDPLIYSTYLGGEGIDYGSGIAVDSAGNAYVTGYTNSTNFPTMNPLQPSGGGGDAFVVKINPAGSAFVYSTYLGGSAEDWGYGIAADSAGNAYVTGLTCSTDFPTRKPLQANYGGPDQSCGDAFVTKINASGSALVYSTYLGGFENDTGYGIAVDSAGDAFVTGVTASTDFPLKNPLQPAYGGGMGDAFVTKINPAGSALLYSTYLGGVGNDPGYGIAVDKSGNAYVTGATNSGDFPIKNALQPVAAGYDDAFVAKINPSGSALVYSTYLGGSHSDFGSGIAADSSGNAYVTGFTGSTNFPVKNPLQPAFGGDSADAFVAEINPMGSALIYSTYLGGSRLDYGDGIAVDNSGNAYVTGATASTNFPLANPFQTKQGGAFVSKIASGGTALLYSTHLGGTGGEDQYGGGIAVDSAGYAYVTGDTGSGDFPLMNPLQPFNGGSKFDAYLTKIDVRAVATSTTLSSSPNPSSYGQAVTFTAVVTSVVGPPPDGESVSFMRGTTALGTGTLSGGTATFTTSALKVGNNSIKAVYGGEPHFAASSSKAVIEIVDKATTTTTLDSSENPSKVGQPVTFTASLAAQFGGTVEGTVTFYDGSTALKTKSVRDGVAEFTSSALTPGTHNITATYNGSTNFDSSSASLTQTVN